MSGKFKKCGTVPVVDGVVWAVEAECLVGIDVGDGRRCLFEIQLGKNAARIDGIGVVRLQVNHRLPLIDHFRIAASKDVEEVVQYSRTGVMQRCLFRLLLLLPLPILAGRRCRLVQFLTDVLFLRGGDP